MEIGGEALVEENDGRPTRRALLQKMAIAAGAGVLAPAIVSSPAFADSGTVKCRFKTTTNGTFIATINRPANNQARFQIITITNPVGTCPCGGAPTFLYSYWAQLTGTSTVTLTSGTTWVNFSSASSGNVSIGGGNGNFGYSLEVAVRVQCPSKTSAPTFLCRYGVSAGSGANSYNVAATQIASSTSVNITLAC
jgi:hypothetical protein